MLADYIVLSRFNYLYPTGTIPSNLFFRKTEKNPYWLANDLENIRFSLSQKGSTPEEEEDVPEDVSEEETEAQEEIAKAQAEVEIENEHDDYDFNITLSNSLNSFIQDGYKAKILGFTDVNLTLKVGDGAVIDFFQKFRERLSAGESISDIRSVVEQETGDLLKNNSLITSFNFDDISIDTTDRTSFVKTVNQLLTRSRIDRRFEHSVTKTVDGEVMTVVMSVGTKDGQSFSSAILPNERTQLHSSTDETFEVGGLTIDFGNINAVNGGLADPMGIPITSDWDLAKDEVELTYEYTDGYKMTFSTPIARSVEEFTTKQTSFFVPPADVDSGKLIATYGIFFDVPIAQRQSSELKNIDMKVLLNLK
jgi:hypothetical protein